MQCQNCGLANKEGRRFCSGCGAELPIICTECGFSNDQGDKFCGGCGKQVSQPDDHDSTSNTNTELNESAVNVLGELRQVTILFADIADYTRLSSERDPEEIHLSI